MLSPNLLQIHLGKSIWPPTQRGGEHRKKKMFTYYFTGPVHQSLQEYWQDGVDAFGQAKAG
jgi:hypothetical protein